jgi:transcriptional regulator with XRE-family HTH domain
MNDVVERWQQWVSEVEGSPELAAEHIKLDFAVALERRMEQQGISRAELARKLGTSAAAITQTLRGDANLSIARMARLAHALDAVVHLHLAPAQGKVRWLETHSGPSVPSAQLSHAKAWAQHSTGADHDRQRTPSAA